MYTHKFECVLNRHNAISCWLFHALQLLDDANPAIIGEKNSNYAIQAVCIEEGAHACITSLTASGFTTAGVEVRDKNSHLIIHKSGLSNACPSGETLGSIGLRAEWPVAGLWVHSGAHCSTTELVVSGCTHGIGVEDTGTNIQVCTLIKCCIYPISYCKYRREAAKLSSA